MAADGTYFVASKDRLMYDIIKSNLLTLFDMKMQRIIVLSTTIAMHALLSTVSFAQNDEGDTDENLVSNYSFERILPNINGDTICPANGGMVSLADQWMAAYGTPDYYNACSNASYPSFGVPQNRLGFQEALYGDAYVSIATYSLNVPNAREYIWQELETALLEGQSYRLRFNVSLADSMNYGVKGIGALLSAENTRDWSQYDFFNIPQMIPGSDGPQVQSDSILTDKENWMEISDVFTAKGGEKYLTIGKFKTDVEEEIERVSDHESTIYNWEESGYYIDNVILEEYSDPSGITGPELTSFNIFPNPAERNGWFQVDYTLENARSNGVELVLYGMDGRQAMHMQLPFLSRKIDITSERLAAGTYVYHLMADGVSLRSGKLVIQ